MQFSYYRVPVPRSRAAPSDEEAAPDTDHPATPPTEAAIGRITEDPGLGQQPAPEDDGWTLADGRPETGCRDYAGVTANRQTGKVGSFRASCYLVPCRECVNIAIERWVPDAQLFWANLDRLWVAWVEDFGSKDWARFEDRWSKHRKRAGLERARFLRLELSDGSMLIFATDDLGDPYLARDPASCPYDLTAAQWISPSGAVRLLGDMLDLNRRDGGPYVVKAKWSRGSDGWPFSPLRDRASGDRVGLYGVCPPWLRRRVSEEVVCRFKERYQVDLSIREEGDDKDLIAWIPPALLTEARELINRLSVDLQGAGW